MLSGQRRKSGITPGSGSAKGGTLVTITGYGFKGTTSVEFGSASTTNYKVIDDKHITVISPAESAFDAYDKPVDVTVTTPKGTSQTSGADRFIYTTSSPPPPPPQPPIVWSLDRSSGPSSGGTAVTINGSGFSGATGVLFGLTAAASFKVVSDNQITAVSPAGNSTVDVTVTTSAGTSKKISGDRFTYIVPLPAVNKIGPTSGAINGEDRVVITGTGFTGAMTVAFGKATVSCGTDSKCTVDSNTQISVVSPAEDPSESSNLVEVTVTTAGGTSATSSADQFTYLPEVDSISPASGPEAGGTSVTINGVGFSNAAKVAFGSAIVDCSDGHSCAINSDGTQIIVNSPHEALSDESQDHVYVTVTDTGGGTSSTNDANKFIYTL
jgi:IPT/TIG domain